MIEIVKQRPFVVVSLILALLLMVGALTFAGPCVHDDGSASACHAAARAIVGGGVVAIVAALVALLVRNAKLAGFVELVSACVGLFAAASPGTLFGLCMMQTMRCWTVMKPFALVCGGALFLCALVGAIVLFRKGKGGAA